MLLSDGVPTVGRPVLGAAQDAADQGVPVSTIAFGTDRGTVRVQGQLVPVPADPDTMASVAELTSGKFFEAVTANELRSVYKDIGTRVGYETEQRDASGADPARWPSSPSWPAFGLGPDLERKAGLMLDAWSAGLDFAAPERLWLLALAAGLPRRLRG